MKASIAFTILAAAALSNGLVIPNDGTHVSTSIISHGAPKELGPSHHQLQAPQNTGGSEDEGEIRTEVVQPAALPAQNQTMFPGMINRQGKRPVNWGHVQSIMKRDNHLAPRTDKPHVVNPKWWAKAQREQMWAEKAARHKAAKTKPTMPNPVPLPDPSKMKDDEDW